MARKRSAPAAPDTDLNGNVKPQKLPTDSTTVITGLAGFVKNNSVLLKKIQKDVIEISQLTREASIYINYYYMRKYEHHRDQLPELFQTTPRFLDFFYHIKKNSKASRYTIDPEYKLKRDHANLPLYDTSYRSNLFVAMSNMYETILMNNVREHIFFRVWKFFKKFFPIADGDTAKPNFHGTMDVLFHATPTKQADPDQMAFWLSEFTTTPNFHNLKRNWSQFIPFLICCHKSLHIQGFPVISSW